MPFDFEAGKRLLLELHALMAIMDFNHFLMQGTALGAYRDKGFTPTELDVDIGCCYETMERQAVDLVAVLTDSGFELETIIRPFRFVRTVVAWKYGVKADIVSFARFGDRRFASAPIDPVNVPRPYCIVHEASLLESYETVEVFGVQFNVPSPIEVYLRREYGDDWQTPREDHISRTRVYNYLNDNPKILERYGQRAS